MKSKLTLFLLIVLTCVSCISNSSKEETLIPNNWKSLDDLQGTWIKIERDSNGYLLYHPCDGRTPGLTISNDSLTLKDQLEQPIVLPIDKIFIANDSITINSNSPKLTAEFVFKLVKP